MRLRLLLVYWALEYQQAVDFFVSINGFFNEMFMEQKFSVLFYVNEKSNPIWLKRSIDSVLSNTVCPDEIVIAATGNICDEIRSIITEFQKKANIQFFSHPVPYGRGTTLEMFLPKCSHELVALQDVESIALPNRFEKQLAYFNATPDIAVLGSYFQEIDVNSLTPIDVHPVPQTDRKIRRFMKTQCPFQHGTVMFKKSVILDSGNYQVYPMFLDDYYLWVRVLGKGYKGANLSDVLVSMPANPDLTWGRALYLFLADRDLCSTMRQLKLMSSFTYHRIVIGRFIKYFLIPTCLRIRKKWIYN